MKWLIPAGGVAALAMFVAGCGSSEPEGYMAGDNLGLDGKPRPVVQQPPSAPGSVGSGQAVYTPDKSAEAVPPTKEATKAEQRSSLGYAPDAQGSGN